MNPEDDEANLENVAFTGLLCVGDDAPTAPLVCENNHEEIFRITTENEIEANGVTITDDDAAVADCFRAWIKTQYDIEVRKAKRGDE